MFLNIIIKYALLILVFLNSFIIDKENRNDITLNFGNYGQYSLNSLASNNTKFPEIYFSVTDINFTYSRKYNIFETVYFISLFDQNFQLIKPSSLSLSYNLGILCNYYSFSINDNIYSIANIYENRYYYCVEYSKISEHAKFGIKIYKIKETSEEIEYNEIFFFTDKLINIKSDSTVENNYKFDINSINKNYKLFLSKIRDNKNKDTSSKETNNLIFSYLQPPLCFLKNDFTQVEGRWYFANIYENYFCFCKGESCINIYLFYKNEFQSCKYYFYLTIIQNNKYIYSKTHYLLSDFFDESIESSDAFPIFQEMIKKKLKAHYITMSWKLYSQFCLKNEKCLNNLEIIYGIRRIDGDALEKYLDIFLKLKVVIAAEKYDGVDNFFYNTDYIIYIFLGHGVQYVKSFLYRDYLSPKNYNKIVLPPSQRFISFALQGGWKNEDIIKITCPKFDRYKIYKKQTLLYNNSEEIEKSIFMMFTWRKVKKGKNVSILYYNNIKNILNNTDINEQLYLNKVKLFFCYHHTLKDKKIINIDNDNIKFIHQHEISTLLKNSSLIITDFSAILFDAIVQRKPLILFIPDGLEPNLENIYSNEYYDTITKIKNGDIYLNEVFLEPNKVIKKIIYYIKNDFYLENEQLQFYKKFGLSNRGNTKKFIKYIQKLK